MTSSSPPHYRGRDTGPGAQPDRAYAGLQPYSSLIFYKAELTHTLLPFCRSLVGYRRFNQALPNAGHLSLSRLERDGVLDLICTQNVDGLHQRAGARKVSERGRHTASSTDS